VTLVPPGLMVRSEPIPRRRASEGNRAAPDAAFDAEFNIRWAAWVARGRVHERRVRLRLVAGAAALAVGTAIGYVFLRL
jgi:hypothetical protein